MKSLVAIGLLLLVAESYAKQLPGTSALAEKKIDTPTQFNLDPARLPQNTVVIENLFVQFECASTSTSGQRIQWWEYVTTAADDGSVISDNEFLFDHPNKDRYTIVHDDDYQYSLLINPVYLADGGYYRCEDTNANPVNKRRHIVSLTVTEQYYNCSTTIIASGVVLEGQYVSNECQIRYKGGLIPNITWTGLLPFDQAYIANSEAIWSGMRLNATREMNSRAYTARAYFTGYFLPVDGDTASNIPVTDGYYSSPQMFVYWGPRTPTITPVQASYVVGDVLTCNADALPPATYLWQNLRNNENFAGPQLIIPEPWIGFNQTLRCNAQNVIEGTIYPSNAFLNVDVPVITQPPTTTQAPTTTPAPPVSPCTDLTGAWKSTSPGPVYSLCIFLELQLARRGVLSGMIKNGTESFWADLYGRAQIDKFDQVGFNGIWPNPVGVVSYAGECHRCYGNEVLLVNSITKQKGTPCGTASPAVYGGEIVFERNQLLQCPNFPKP